MARSKHVHKFVCIGRKGYDSKIWKCALPDCTWFVHLGLSHVMLGKPSRCWECDEVFIINEDSLKDDMPKCVNCIQPIITEPIVTTRTSMEPIRTPEQQRIYEREMREILGPDWKKVLNKE